ncbi:hypothetical protein [Nonomuraea rubra]|uniref:Uncharacterized protein n=1 Tax=Nonomuraea rubra TaxID=46180 RepID=A0A7X0TXD6_9ACTN|nr:hypothetical protein [Nonomuraea rubra]MBB6547079.1 hypothetical protein [Nonomuraea rubra]
MSGERGKLNQDQFGKAAVLVDAVASAGSAAADESDLAAFDVAEELLPVLVGGALYSSLGRKLGGGR